MAGKKILLVEGIDDKHVFLHICRNRNVPLPDDAVKSLEGVDQLLEDFSVRLNVSEEGDIIGLVVDADDDMTSRWESLRNRLIEKGYLGVPDEPVAVGTILDPPVDTLKPRVGIWIMPDNRTNGVLEDFLKFLVPEGSRLFDHVESSVAAIPERRFGESAKPKAVIHTWLAWQKEPGKRLGTAIKARYLDPGVAQVDVLVSWLNRLFFQQPGTDITVLPG